MIYESWIYKRELFRISKILKKYSIQTRWSELSLARLEKEIFISAYVIRKLKESKKLSYHIRNTNIPVLVYKNKKGNITHLDRHEIEKYYDIDNPSKANMDLNTLCNSIIHSWVFDFHFDRNIPTGIFINSDKTRNEKVWHISVSKLIELIDIISNDDVVKHKMIRDKNGDWIEIDPESEADSFQIKNNIH